MRFALVNGERVEASPKLAGICPGCLEPVRAKCGTKRMRHWAHLADAVCDSWKEKETEWHRAWKAHYPLGWQECRQQDKLSGEWHIADVRSQHGLVIEFQYSHIEPQERIARERFHRNMVWVVSGTRLKNDYPRFMKGMSNRVPTQVNNVFLIADPKTCFNSLWLESSVPVFFDFGDGIQSNPPDKGRELLWCLLPNRFNGSAIVVPLAREEFISETSNQSDLVKVLSGLYARVAGISTRQSSRLPTPADLYRARIMQGRRRTRR